MLAACEGDGGSVTSSDPAAGKHLFVEHCARCHTLEAAGAEGTRAADLDIIRPTYEQVSSCVTHGIPGEMPAFGKKRTLTPQQIRDGGHVHLARDETEQPTDSRTYVRSRDAIALRMICAASAASAGSASSAGWWLTPSLQGTKTIALGTRSATHIVSCAAPECIVM